MGIARGPNIVTDGLVFGYDTGYGVADNETTTRFYPGEATTNLFTYPYLSNHTDNTSSTTSIVKEDFGGGLKGIRFTQASTSPILSFTVGVPTTPVSGGTYTWSSYVHSTSTGSKLKSQVSVYVNGVRHWLTNSNTWATSTVECNHLFKATVANEWHRVDNQITMPTGTLTSFSAGGFYRSTSNFTIKVANLQFEQKGHVTPFTATSRSSTQSLIDLKRTTNIDVSNVSFDSTGQPTFDGTDDNLDADLQLNYGNFSVEMIARWNSLSDLFCAGSGTAGAGLTGGTNFNAHMTTSGFYVRSYSPPGGPSGWNASSTVSSTSSTSTTYHITVVNIGTVWYFYKNGTLVGSVDALYTPNSASTRVGIFRNHVQSVGNAGKVYAFKTYNKALSAEEVKQNFNALKNRFNI